jgi:hypothetical protein
MERRRRRPWLEARQTGTWLSWLEARQTGTLLLQEHRMRMASMQEHRMEKTPPPQEKQQHRMMEEW